MWLGRVVTNGAREWCRFTAAWRARSQLDEMRPNVSVPDRLDWRSIGMDYNEARLW